MIKETKEVPNTERDIVELLAMPGTEDVEMDSSRMMIRPREVADELL